MNRLSQFVRFGSLMAAMAALMILVGCESHQSTAGPADPPPTQPMMTTGNTMAFPTGRKSDSIIWVEKVMPAQVRAGQPFEYQIKVTNLTDQTLQGVVVSDTLSDGVQMAAGGDQHNVGTLRPHQTKTIDVRATAPAAGQFSSCLTVSYNPSLCLETPVINPALKVERMAPASVSACEPFPITYRVTNVGTGTATDVVVMERLADNQTAADGTRDVSFRLASLPEGQSQEFTVNSTVSRPGRYIGQAAAKSQYVDQVTSAEVTTVAVAPVLEVAVSGPEKAYTDRDVNYTIRVTNKGDGVANNLTVSASQPTGATGGQNTWSIQPLQPGQAADITYTVKTGTEGRISTTVTAEALCAAKATAQAATDIQGLTSLLLEVVDRNDPIALNTNEVYDIIVKNQGTKTDTNVKIVATVPAEMEIVSIAGGTGQRDGNKVTFSVGSLAGGQTSTMSVTIKGIKTGDVRFAVELNSDSLETPVRETEATRIY